FVKKFVRATGLHDRLLEAYARHWPNGWPSGPDDGYYFQQLGWHLVQAGRAEELRRLLLDYRWLEAKLAAAGPVALCSDYDLPLADGALALVQGALRLSAHVLSTDRRQLAGQLLGRLLGNPSAAIGALLEGAATPKDHAWLRPLAPNLIPP